MRIHPIPLVAAAVLSCALGAAHAAPVTFSVGGSDDPASIQATVDAFRAALGEPNNGNAAGAQAGGRREINWDGGGDAAPATTFPIPMTTFQGRGAVFTTPGTGFEISGQPTPEFGDINAAYPDQFTAFSSPRLFTALGSNVTDVLFFVPGSDTPATSSGFGAVFSDVDLAGSTFMQFFGAGNSLLHSAPVAPGTTQSGSLSFLGILFDAGEAITRVRITSGNAALGGLESDSIDLVVMDDFIYAEPQELVQALPEPAVLTLLACMLAAALLLSSRRPRALQRLRRPQKSSATSSR